MITKYDKLFGEGWARILSPFLESEEFKTIGKYLKQQVNAGKKIYPTFDDMFRAFKECPYEELNAVWLTNNAYQSQMDGIAFSVSEESITVTPDPLIKIFDAIEQDVAKGLYLHRVNDLTRWANQGILLLNCDLSTEKGAKPGVHLDLWKPFIEFVLKTLSEYNPGLFYVLIGTKSSSYSSCINAENNHILELEHPMMAVKEKRPWRHKNVFHEISLFSKFMNNTVIDWTMPYTVRDQKSFENSGFKLQKI